LKLARLHGTPLVVVDHEQIRRNFRTFRHHLPRVQPYYAVKANPAPEIVRTLYNEGSSFDVASLQEFMMVYECIRNLPPEQRQNFIWDKIIYANPIKANRTLRELDPYRPLVVYDNAEEVAKCRQYAPHAGLVLRIRVPNTGSMVELASKFGAAPSDAVDLIKLAAKAGFAVEGLSFHVGSQCTNFGNFVTAIGISAEIFREARSRGFRLKLLDIGGGFPAPYDQSVKPFAALARLVNRELRRLFPTDIEIIAEPGRFMVATAAVSVSSIIGKAVRDGKLCYYIDDGVYHTFSGVVFDHCQYHFKAFRKGPVRVCSVFGPTCDALDTVSVSESLPSNLRRDDLLFSENIGAYSYASATHFNGFPPAKVVHINL